MKKLIILFVILLVSIGVIVAQEDEITWELVSDEAISVRGEYGTWNSTYNEPGAVIYHDGLYHLFVNGYAGFPANTGIGYKTSEDGINYEWVTDEPLFRRDDVAGSPVAIATTDVIVLDDGTWVLYFYNFNSSTWPRVQGTIGRATSDNPAGEWVIDDEPVLVPGDEGSWDEDSVAFASVTQIDDTFVMYYIGESGGVEALGRATSDDGILWEKHSEPVFVFDITIGEAVSFVVSEVIYDGERWILAYKSRRDAIGFAFSEDGISWERYPENPVISASDIESISSIGYISLLADEDNNYSLFFEGNIGSSTQIYAANVVLPE